MKQDSKITEFVAPKSAWQELVERAVADMMAPPRAKYQAGLFILDCGPTRSGEYEIEASRANTPEKLLGWLMHLSEKSWFTGDHLESLIATAAAHFGWNVRR